MKSLANDIRLTLIIKITLIFLLWFVCFKDAKKPVINPQQWFLGHSEATTKIAPPNQANVQHPEPSSPKDLPAE